MGTRSVHRGPQERQRVPLRGLVGPGQATLRAAGTLMEANLEEPLAMHELSRLLDVSTRQLERLFRDQLECTPTQHYLEIRLTRARQLLRRTDHSISRVAAECGFTSLPHFTNRYRARFGLPPGMDRRSFAPSRAASSRAAPSRAAAPPRNASDRRKGASFAGQSRRRP